MKTIRPHVITLVLLFSISSCQKPSTEKIQDQKSLLFNEQANPGINGEIHDFVINGDTITCEKINGKYVFQGDMILTEDQLLRMSSSKGTGLESFVKRWTNNTVLYKIADDLPNKSRVTDAIKYWEENTPLKFIEWYKFIETSSSFHSWEIPSSVVEFKWDKDGSYSNVGMLGDKPIGYILIGEQEIGLADWADKGTVIHEIGHTVGLVHEHSRSDRDRYINISLNNVESGQEHNFDKIITQFETSNFDFNSIMLYSSFAFSTNGLPTITKLDGSTYEAQRENLSEEDIRVINLIYLSPVVYIYPPTNITDQSATVEFDVTSQREANVIETGIYYGASPNPETTGNKKIIGNETGKNSITLIGLAPNSTYYIRAYSTNNEATSYSDQVTFSTFGVMDVDTNGYKTVIIGNQEWLSENLKTTKYNDGQLIPLVTDNSAWISLSTPGYCWYQNDDRYKSDFGALYNWFAVNTSKLCPTGWHVPTDIEWNTLITFLGGPEIAGGKLKEAGTEYWSDPNTGATNESGFTALPGGFRFLEYGFTKIFETGNWWAATESTNLSNNAWSVWMYSNDNGMYITDCCTNDKNQGKSVRCLKDN